MHLSEADRMIEYKPTLIVTTSVERTVESLDSSQILHRPNRKKTSRVYSNKMHPGRLVLTFLLIKTFVRDKQSSGNVGTGLHLLWGTAKYWICIHEHVLQFPYLAPNPKVVFSVSRADTPSSVWFVPGAGAHWINISLILPPLHMYQVKVGIYKEQTYLQSTPVWRIDFFTFTLNKACKYCLYLQANWF